MQSNNLNFPVTWGRNVQVRELQTVQFNEICSRIKNGSVKSTIDKLRSITDTESQRDYKKNSLPWFSFSLFDSSHSRRNDTFKQTQYLVYDIDIFDKSIINQVREKLEKDPRVFCIFESPRGGIKFALKFNNLITDYKIFECLWKYYREILMDNYSIELDKKGCDAAHAVFLSYDPNIYVNPDCEPIQTNVDFKVFETVPANINYSAVPEDLKFLPLAIQYLKGRINNYYDWSKLGFALCSLGNEGLRYFLDVSLGNPEYPKDTVESITRQFSYFKMYYNPQKISIKSVFYIAIRYGYQYSQTQKPSQEPALPQQTNFQTFWRLTFKDNGGPPSISFAYRDYLNWLRNAKGIYRFKKNSKGEEFICITNNIAEFISLQDIKRITFDYLKSLPDYFDGIEKSQLIEFLLKGSGRYFNMSHMECTPTLSKEFFRDTQDEAFLFFKNSIVQINKDSIQQSDYSKLDKLIWKSQVLDFEFNLQQEKETGEYCKFIKNICNNSIERYKALKSIIGYLLHTYKDASNTYAIILTDEAISDNPEGGTGKGIFVRALSKVRKVAKIDASHVSKNKNFPFQTVGLDTQLIAIDEATKRFNFEDYFSLITEGIMIEKKGKNAVFIDFKNSPKLIISTNWAIQGTGNSHSRRRIEFELSQHYNGNHTPVKEFGHLLFDQWTDEEYTNFYNFMIHCVQYYLANGIKQPDNINYAVKKFKSVTSDNFVEWWNDYTPKQSRMLAADLRKNFLDSNPEEDERFCTPTRFNKWLKLIKEFTQYKDAALIRGSRGKVLVIPTLANAASNDTIVNESIETSHSSNSEIIEF